MGTMHFLPKRHRMTLVQNFRKVCNTIGWKKRLDYNVLNPKNMSKFRSIIGSISQHFKFVPNLSTF